MWGSLKRLEKITVSQSNIRNLITKGSEFFWGGGGSGGRCRNVNRTIIKKEYNMLLGEGQIKYMKTRTL
jgi:hypothetical protein